jgi:tRNA(Leu) C34 or U34 (ribose-2'-O)-methylase TrmL
MNVFLDAPQDFEHICVISRTLGTLGVERCYVHDPNRLIRLRYGKSRTRRLKKVSAGAFFHVVCERVEKPETFLAVFSGRKVATVPDQRATSLSGFPFHPDDTHLFGSEGHGIRPELLALCENQ